MSLQTGGASLFAADLLDYRSTAETAPLPSSGHLNGQLSRGDRRVKTPFRFQIVRPAFSQILISLLIAGLGLMGARALSQVDQDLRIMYTEYTLGATDLAHISADIMRFRTTIIRALEAPTKKDFDRITASLPDQRARIQHAIDRYAAASLRVS